ncbi:MAG: thiamine pyrophosphate-dependent enzyme, partial [Chloroflexi bacterium]|nr:thiamine pyrophosphate-dependent enzyme [Chloroflexota bacterium]
MTQLDQRFGLNAGYVAELYERYLKDPASVSEQLRALFDTWDVELEAPEKAARKAPPVAASVRAVIALANLVRDIRESGHRYADLDPLGLRKPDSGALEPASYGLSEGDIRELPADLVDSPLALEARTAGELVSRLRRVFCGKIGYQFSHLHNEEERAWLQNAVESRQFSAELSKEFKRSLLEGLSSVEAFEKFLHSSFPGQKWFSLEGNDTLIPVLDAIIWDAAHSTPRALVIGMAHRGRLNVLAHIFGKGYESILAEFAEGHHTHGSSFEGFEPGWMKDVKYHQGARWVTPSETGGELSLALLPNPSHLEMVGPVVRGAVRALQEDSGRVGRPEIDRDAAVAVVIHGDASFAGQGVVSESFNMSQLGGYDIGGALHIVVNNQIGFTTDPQDAFSGEYCTDGAKGYSAPIIHVNADDVEACLSVAWLAFAYRQKFHRDIVIDLVGYRRFGHNEGDEPSFTQPLMYRAIDEHPTARKILADRLVGEGVVTEDEAEAMLHEATSRLRRAMESLNGSPPAELSEALMMPRDYLPEERRASTALPEEAVRRLNEEITAVPDGFTVNPRLERALERRRHALQDEGRIDWAHAEALALASILADGIPVRLTG